MKRKPSIRMKRAASARAMAEAGQPPAEGLSRLAGQIHGSAHGVSPHTSEEGNGSVRLTTPEFVIRRGKDSLFAILTALRVETKASNKLWVFATLFSFFQVRKLWGNCAV